MGMNAAKRERQARVKNRTLLQNWRATHGAESIRWVVNHAKLATIETGEFKLLLRGSMNLNYNPRFEQFDVDEGHPGFEVVRKVESELPVLRFDCSCEESRAASGIQQAFGLEKLRPFEGFKVWAK
jgi:hypothetical protein